MGGWVQVQVQQIQCFWWASWLHSPSWDRFGSSDDATNPTIILRTGNPSKSALLVPRDKFGDPPPGSGSQPLWAGIENTGQSVSHSVPTPALRVPKTHLGANLGARNLCGKILELFVFSLPWTFMLLSCCQNQSDSISLVLQVVWNFQLNAIIVQSSFCLSLKLRTAASKRLESLNQICNLVNIVNQIIKIGKYCESNMQLGKYCESNYQTW